MPPATSFWRRSPPRDEAPSWPFSDLRGGARGHKDCLPTRDGPDAGVAGLLALSVDLTLASEAAYPAYV
jgi:hypothetical protein